MKTVFIKEPIQLFPKTIRVYLPTPPKVIKEGDAPEVNKAFFVDQTVYLRPGEKLSKQQMKILATYAKQEYEESTQHKAVLQGKKN